MNALASVSQFFQNLVGNFSFASADHRWLFIGFAVFVVLLIVFTQDKPKAITILIIIYAVWFVALLIPGISANIEKTISENDLFILNIVIGSLPITALFVFEYKKGKKKIGTS